jgi:hypothetical protein
VDILHHEDQRPLAALPQDHLSQDLEGPRLHLFRAEHRRAVGRGRQSEELQHERCRSSLLKAQRGERRPDLVCDRFGTVGVRDGARRPEHVEDRQIRHRRGVGETAPLKAADSLTGQVLAGLVEEP